MSIRVLVGCECSQVVCSAFRAAGCDAFSCDVQDCYGGHPEWHIKGDVLQVVDSSWDLFVCHPPCTYLSKCNGFLLRRYPWRFDLGLKAADFFRRCLSAPVPFVCVENPIPLHCFGLPPYSQCINPYEFGHPFTKGTCLWLKNLPALFSEHIIIRSSCRSWVNSVPHKNYHDRQRLRSQTFAGIAAAMVRQWLPFVGSVSA